MLVARDHRVSAQEVGEGRVQAMCSYGWRSPVFGEDKTTGTMDPSSRPPTTGTYTVWMSMQ